MIFVWFVVAVTNLLAFILVCCGVSSLTYELDGWLSSYSSNSSNSSNSSYFLHWPLKHHCIVGCWYNCYCCCCSICCSLLFVHFVLFCFPALYSTPLYLLFIFASIYLLFDGRRDAIWAASAKTLINGSPNPHNMLARPIINTLWAFNLILYQHRNTNSTHYIIGVPVLENWNRYQNTRRT